MPKKFRIEKTYLIKQIYETEHDTLENTADVLELWYENGPDGFYRVSDQKTNEEFRIYEVKK